MVKAVLLTRLRDEQTGAEAFLRWALRYSSGGNGYDRLPDSLRQQVRANGPASMAELISGTGEHLSKGQVSAIACPVLCVTGELSDRAFARATDYSSACSPPPKSSGSPAPVTPSTSSAPPSSPPPSPTSDPKPPT